MSLSKFNSTFEYKLIYIFRINDKKHNGCLKIGDATIHTDKNYSSFSPNCHELNHAARERIDSQLFTMYKFDNDEITVINSLFE